MNLASGSGEDGHTDGAPIVELDVTPESSSMERLLELALVAELTRKAWFGRRQPISGFDSSVDAIGYDLVLECGRIIRHV